MAESINHPAHYGGDTTYEAIKVIKAWELGFCLGNTVKYISRAGKKDPTKTLEDLKRAAWYLGREIGRIEGGAKMKKAKALWVIAGGRPGEIGHCTRCGDGLNLGDPQLLEVAVAAMKAFVKAHSSCQDTGRKDETPTIPQDWARGRDTGVSSETIYSVLTGHASPCRSHDIPHDPDDFGRCYRLLELFPAWKHRLGAVAAAHPAWKPFVREWDKLTAMYEAVAFQGGIMRSPHRDGRQPHELSLPRARTRHNGDEMYKFMKQLEEEGNGKH